MNAVTDEILRTNTVLDRSGKTYALQSHVDRFERELVSRLIDSDASVCKTLEVGCAFGLSSLTICTAIAGRKDARHVIIDPWQHSDWHGVGVFNLERAGFDFFDLIESPSELALPEIVRRESGTFDFVLIDGWHTFDHTMIDLFYANRLIRKGGYILVDDSSWPSVSKAVSYFLKYPSYILKAQSEVPITWKGALKRILTTLLPPAIAPWILSKQLYDTVYASRQFSSMVALQKIKEDDRSWRWYRAF